MNQKKAKILRARIYGHGGAGSRELRRELLSRRRYLARVKERDVATNEFDSQGQRIVRRVKFITVYNDPESLRSKYQRAKRAA